MMMPSDPVRELPDSKLSGKGKEMTAETVPSLEDRVEFIRNRLGIEDKLTILSSDMANIFETGVLATVRITAERFSFSIKLDDLGLVPTRDRQKDKIKTAIESVLRSSQRASLLPRDEMYYLDLTGKKIAIMFPEATERQVRFMFPTRYDDETIRQPDTASTSTWHAVPMNGMTFIPLVAWDTWNKDFEQAKRMHTQSAQILVDNYDRLKSASINHYVQIALDVYNRLQQTAPNQLLRSVKITETNSSAFGQPVGTTITLPISPLQWIRRWKRAVLRAWPTKEEILRNYSVNARFFWVPLPSSVAEDRLRRDQADAEILQSRAEVQSYRNASEIIARRVKDTQGSQVYDLTVSYVKTILERTEMVFMNFLNFAESKNRVISPQQINSIMKVVSMIKTMGNGVSGLSGIKSEAEKIEKYINDNIDIIEGKTGNKQDRKTKSTEMTMNLPEAIARAVDIMRVEAEGLIGLEARRTVFSDQNPYAVLESIRMQSYDPNFRAMRSFSQSDMDDEDASRIEVTVPELNLFAADTDEDDWSSARRTR